MQQSTIELDLRNNKIDELKETSLSFRLTCPPLKKKQSEQNNTYLAREQVMFDRDRAPSPTAVDGRNRTILEKREFIVSDRAE